MGTVANMTHLLILPRRDLLQKVRHALALGHLEAQTVEEWHNVLPWAVVYDDACATCERRLINVVTQLSQHRRGVGHTCCCAVDEECCSCYCCKETVIQQHVAFGTRDIKAATLIPGFSGG